MMKVSLLVILLMQLLSLPARSSQSDMLVERYNMTRLDLTVGLPHDHVTDIFVDSRGFVWVSSYGGGAVRYDGYSFMAPQQGDSRSCLGFSEDRHQRLWIAYDEETVVIDLKKMQRVVPKYGSHDIGALLRRASVKVYCDSKGAMWQVARDSIYRYEFNESGDVTSISRCRYQGNTPDITICDIENNGNVWVSTMLGLSRLHLQGNSLQFSPIHAVLQTLKGLYVTDLLRQGSLVWIATNQGLFSYDLYNSTLQTYRHTSDKRSLSHNHATALALTSDGHLLVGTLRGICLFDATRSDFVCWNSSTAGNPLPSDFIHCLLNYDGQLWIGTETAGIVRLTAKPLLLQNYVHQAGNPMSLPSNPVNAMYASHDGTLWVGNVEGGLSRLMVNNERLPGGFVHWTTTNSALSHNSVSVLQPDAHGRLWIGTWGGGINSIALQGNAQPQRHHVWAPDVIKWHGHWWLAYSCSTFGKNGSAIGLLSAPSLSYPVWNDEGCIVTSKAKRNDWNAIDPNFVIDDEDNPWLTWGSFWDGIQLVRLDTTMHVAIGEQPRTIARRYDPASRNVAPNPTSKYAGTNAIEAPFIFKHAGWYYLFVSWDYCCRGSQSNYRVAVGRSRQVYGPYLDRNGQDMAKGGGTLFLEGDKKAFEAAGHCAAYHMNGEDIFICHGYSIAHNGSSILIQRPIRWTSDGWPVLVNN